MRSFIVLSFVSLAALAALSGCGGGGSSGPGGSGGSTSTGMPGTGGTTTGTGTGTGGNATGSGGGSGTVLTNNDATCEDKSIGPAAGEEHHLAAARLTPPSYPFVVTAVRYVLDAQTGNCDAGLAHTVDVFVDTAVAPPATPSVLRHFDNAMIAKPTQDRVVTLDLDPPVTLQSGEHLFIAVSMAGTFPDDILCVGTCAGPAYQEDRNYWSNADAPPYPWQTLGSFGLPQNYKLDAIGQP